MNPAKPEAQVADEGTTRMSRDTLSITDNRTGKSYEVPIKLDTIHATDLRQIKVKSDEFGMMSYDPAFNNTALLPEQNHVHRRRQRHPALSRLFDRGTGGEEHVSRNGLFDSAWRAAHPLAA